MITFTFYPLYIFIYYSNTYKNMDHHMASPIMALVEFPHESGGPMAPEQIYGQSDKKDYMTRIGSSPFARKVPNF